MDLFKKSLAPFLFLLVVGFIALIDYTEISHEAPGWAISFTYLILLSLGISSLWISQKFSNRPFEKIDFLFLSVCLGLWIFILYSQPYAQSLSRDELTQLSLSEEFYSLYACGFQSQPFLICALDRTLQVFSSAQQDLPYKILSSTLGFGALFYLYRIGQVLCWSILLRGLSVVSLMLMPLFIRYSIEIRPIILGVFASTFFLYQYLRHQNQISSRLKDYLPLIFSTFLLANSVGLQSTLLILCVLAVQFVFFKNHQERFLAKALLLGLILYMPAQIFILSGFDAASGPLVFFKAVPRYSLFESFKMIFGSWVQNFGWIYFVPALFLLVTKQLKQFLLSTKVSIVLFLFFLGSVFIFSRIVVLGYQPKYSLIVAPWILVLFFNGLADIKKSLQLISTKEKIFSFVVAGFFLFPLYKYLEYKPVSNYSVKAQLEWLSQNIQPGDFVMNGCLNGHVFPCFARNESIPYKQLYFNTSKSSYDFSRTGMIESLVALDLKLKSTEQHKVRRLIILVERNSGSPFTELDYDVFQKSGFEVYQVQNEMILVLIPPLKEKLKTLKDNLTQQKSFTSTGKKNTEAFYLWTMGLGLVFQDYAYYVASVIQYLESGSNRDAPLYIKKLRPQEKIYFDETVFR